MPDLCRHVQPDPHPDRIRIVGLGALPRGRREEICAPSRRGILFLPVAGRIADRKHADVAQLVEHHLAKVRVAGSSPVVRSEKVIRTSSKTILVEWPRGEATDCKSVYTGSNPVSTSGGWRSGSALP